MAKGACFQIFFRFGLAAGIALILFFSMIPKSAAG